MLSGTYRELSKRQQLTGFSVHAAKKSEREMNGVVLADVVEGKRLVILELLA